MDIPETGVIYCIVNKINEKVYVGQTIDLRSRWNSHKSYLRNNTHNNQHLNRSWNKYGEDSFEFKVIEEGVELEKLTEREDFWIKKYNSTDDKFGYNATNACVCKLVGYKAPKEIGRKISETHKAKGIRPSPQCIEALHKRMTGPTNPNYGMNQGGENGYYHKLTWEDVKEIRRLNRFERIGSVRLGRTFGVSAHTVVMILSNKSWVDEEYGRILEQDKKIENNRPNSSKLSYREIEEIKQLIVAEEKTYKEIGKLYGVTAGCIQGLVRRRKWNHKPKNKLNEEKVREIRKLIADNIGYGEISAKFGVCRAVICNIKKGKIWKNVQ